MKRKGMGNYCSGIQTEALGNITDKSIIVMDPKEELKDLTKINMKVLEKPYT